MHPDAYFSCLPGCDPLLPYVGHLPDGDTIRAWIWNGKIDSPVAAKIHRWSAGHRQEVVGWIVRVATPKEVRLYLASPLNKDGDYPMFGAYPETVETLFESIAKLLESAFKVKFQVG